jgi:hypothetical protein
MKKPKEVELGSSPGAYKPPTYRGVLLMFIVALIGIALVWLAYASVVAEPGTSLVPVTQLRL